MEYENRIKCRDFLTLLLLRLLRDCKLLANRLPAEHACANQLQQQPGFHYQPSQHNRNEREAYNASSQVVVPEGKRYLADVPDTLDTMRN